MGLVVGNNVINEALETDVEQPNDLEEIIDLQATNDFESTELEVHAENADEAF